MIVIIPAAEIAAERTLAEDVLYDKVHGMWLGQLIANMAGRPTEGAFGSTPNPATGVPWVLKQTWDADDDTDIEYIAMHILETNGLGCTNQDLSDQWLTHCTASGIYIANRQAWYLMGDGYAPPLSGSRHYNIHWYAIDAQITTEVLGAVSPGMVQPAIDLTGTFARISNEGFPLHAAQLYAAMYAEGFFADPVDPNMTDIVTQALEVIPTTSRTHHIATDVLEWYRDDLEDEVLDWRATRQLLYDHYMGSYSHGRYYNWIESGVNTGATILCLLYGGGDFKETVQIGILAGWDCDCNPATAGGLIGIIKGYSGLPADLTDPAQCGNVYKNVYRPYLPDPELPLPQYEDITSIAGRIAALAEANILANGGYLTTEPNVYHIPDPAAIVTEPENVDPLGPTGLVSDAITAGITVTPTASVAYYNTSNDRYHLYGIIDGITDNSYNGHRAYWSYVSNPELKPDEDWYQLNFSQPVKFSSLTFYEGEIVWYGINTYYRYDTPRGGFFEDIAVEILRDGEFITPANVVMSEPLDQYKIYQTIRFDFAPTVGNAIRIIGTAGGSQKYTTIMELVAEGDVAPGFYAAGVDINEEQPQRSRVDNIAITFSEDATITAGAVELAGTTNGTVVTAQQIQQVYDSGSSRLTLTFDMNNDQQFGDTLPEDTYALRLLCSAITNGESTPLLDDDAAPGDGWFTIAFHRLYGDANGSGTVDLADLSILANVWLEPAGTTGLDVNEDGVVTITDYGNFAENWLKTLP